MNSSSLRRLVTGTLRTGVWVQKIQCVRHKNCKEGDTRVLGIILRSEISPGGGNGNSFQYS